MCYTSAGAADNYCTVQLVAKDWIVFSVGREFSYLAAGMVENAVPSYQSELSPAVLRGFFAGSIMGINTAGNVWGAGMSRAFATETGRVGYMVPVAVQLAPALMILALVPFCVGKCQDCSCIPDPVRVTSMASYEKSARGSSTFPRTRSSESRRTEWHDDPGTGRTGSSNQRT